MLGIVLEKRASLGVVVSAGESSPLLLKGSPEPHTCALIFSKSKRKQYSRKLQFGNGKKKTNGCRGCGAVGCSGAGGEGGRAWGRVVAGTFYFREERRTTR